MSLSDCKPMRNASVETTAPVPFWDALFHSLQLEIYKRFDLGAVFYPGFELLDVHINESGLKGFFFFFFFSPDK